MKITGLQLKRLIREFKNLNFSKDAEGVDLDLFDGGLPPVEPPNERGGGGDDWPTRIVEKIIETGKYSQWPANSRVAYHDNGEARLYARASDAKGAIICTLVLNDGTVLDKYDFGGHFAASPVSVYIRLLNIHNRMCDESAIELARSAASFKQYDKHIIDFMSRNSGPMQKGPDCKVVKEQADSMHLSVKQLRKLIVEQLEIQRQVVNAFGYTWEEYIRLSREKTDRIEAEMLAVFDDEPGG